MEIIFTDQESIMSDDAEPNFEAYLNTLLKSRIFQNPDLLSHKYIPPRLIARDQEIMRVMQLFATRIKYGSYGTNAIIVGMPGCGKTAVVRYVLNLINKQLQKHEGTANALPVYVQCRYNQTQQKVLYHILTTLDPSTKTPKSGVALSDYLDEIFRVMNSREMSLVLVLDEIDLMRGDDALYLFSRAKEQGLLEERIDVTIIGLTNDLKYLGKLDPRVRSSLLAEEIAFPSYSAPDITQILTARGEAFHEGVLEGTVIPLCAAYSAQMFGDCRRAIDLLRKAGELAEKEGAPTVTEAHVRRARDGIEADITYDLVRGLPTQIQLVLFSFLAVQDTLQVQAVQIGDLYGVYGELCKRQGRDLLGMRRVTDLLEELRMLGILETRVVSRGRYGRTKEIFTGLNLAQLTTTLKPIIDINQDLDLRQLCVAAFGIAGGQKNLKGSPSEPR